MRIMQLGGRSIALKTRIGEQTERCRSLPRVDHGRAGCFKICDVARYDRHPMDKSRGRYNRVTLCTRVWYMQARAAQCDGLIQRKDAAGELRQNSPVQPGAQHRALCGVFPLLLQYAQFQLQYRDRRYELRGDRLRRGPCEHLGTRSLRLTQLG